MTILERATTVDEVLAAARRMAPSIAARAAEIEAARRVPRDLLDELIGAGAFRVLLPRSHGGIGATLPEALDVLETFAAADASVGWVVMIGGGAWCDLAGLPRATFDELFPGTGDVIVAGVFNPTGSITPVDDGFRVTGRWSFASGCEHATWLFGCCLAGVVDGVPQLRGAVFAPDQVVIEDTWTVSGLCGTGSHHFHVTDLAVPGDRTFEPLTDEPCLDEPIVRIPAPSLYALVIASVAVGTAQGALDEVVALATDKVPLLAPAPLAADPGFHIDLATADAELRAARLLLHADAELAWATAVAGDPFTLEQRARIRATAAWVADRAAAVVATAYRSGGGSSLYATSPLQRRLRDVSAITQHFLVQRTALRHAGAVLAGQELHVPVF
jgi:indole-3-acetate monooxygenase